MDHTVIPGAGNILTARLLLRRPHIDDLPVMHAIHTDPDTNRYNPGGPSTAEGSASALQSWLLHWEMRGYGYWSICLPQDPATPIGFGGIHHKMVGEREGLNLYFRFTPSAWGKGYANEMAQAAMRLAFDSLDAAEVLAKVRPYNLPSRKAIERLGMALIGETRDVDNEEPSLIYRLDAAQYDARG